MILYHNSLLLLFLVVVLLFLLIRRGTLWLSSAIRLIDRVIPGEFLSLGEVNLILWKGPNIIWLLNWLIQIQRLVRGDLCAHCLLLLQCWAVRLSVVLPQVDLRTSLCILECLWLCVALCIYELGAGVLDAAWSLRCAMSDSRRFSYRCWTTGSVVLLMYLD